MRWLVWFNTLFYFLLKVFNFFAFSAIFGVTFVFLGASPHTPGGRAPTPPLSANTRGYMGQTPAVTSGGKPPHPPGRLPRRLHGANPRRLLASTPARLFSLPTLLPCPLLSLIPIHPITYPPALLLIFHAYLSALSPHPSFILLLTLSL